MKNNFTVTLLILLLATSVFSQSDEKYTNTLDFAKQAFNEKKTLLIYQKFNSDLKKKLKEVDFKTTIDSLYTEKGKIISYELIMDDEKEKNYLIEFENATMLLLIYLTTDDQISLFKIKEY